MSLVRFAHSGHSFMTTRNSREIFYEHGHNILLYVFEQDFYHFEHINHLYYLTRVQELDSGLHVHAAS